MDIFLWITLFSFRKRLNGCGHKKHWRKRHLQIFEPSKGVIRRAFNTICPLPTSNLEDISSTRGVCWGHCACQCARAVHRASLERGAATERRRGEQRRPERPGTRPHLPFNFSHLKYFNIYLFIQSILLFLQSGRAVFPTQVGTGHCPLQFSFPNSANELKRVQFWQSTCNFLKIEK